MRLLRISGSNFANSSVTSFPFSMVLCNLLAENILNSRAWNTHEVHKICL